MAPYRPQTWSLGGTPTKDIDIPITAVLLAFYIGGAIIHMTILRVNNKAGHKFLMSGMLFGFCMARTTTCVLRIASVSVPDNIPLSIAAAIFVFAGVVLVFVINLIFAQRIIRAHHPHIGWHPLTHWFFIAIPVLIVVTLIMLITSAVQSFYTLDSSIHQVDRGLLLYGNTAYGIISFLPIPLVLMSLIIKRRVHVDKFGQGRFRTKIAVLLAASALVSSGAWWRCATNWKHPVPRTQPLPWYFHRVYFYIFDFVVEIFVIYLYAFLRVDLRFHVPNGAHGPGSYRAGAHNLVEKELAYNSTIRVYSEEETFDDVAEGTSHSATFKASKTGAIDLERGSEHETI